MKTDESNDRKLRRLTRWVARCGEAAASLAGLECVTERSPGSESTYLHARHGGQVTGEWRGLRISCHAPAYACCHDYEQLLLPREPTPTALRRAAWRVQCRVRVGGLVVADPRRVADAIDRLSRQLSDGRRYRDASGARWRWDAASGCWTSVDAEHDDGPRDASPPRHSGVRIVSPRVRCEIRHAMNTAAKWAAELAAETG